MRKPNDSAIWHAAYHERIGGDGIKIGASGNIDARKIPDKRPLARLMRQHENIASARHNNQYLSA